MGEKEIKIERVREREKANVIMTLEPEFQIIHNREQNEDLESPVLSIVFCMFKEQNHVLTS